MIINFDVHISDWLHQRSLGSYIMAVAVFSSDGNMRMTKYGCKRDMLDCVNYGFSLCRGKHTENYKISYENGDQLLLFFLLKDMLLRLLPIIFQS